jgi:hypothetical protein
VTAKIKNLMDSSPDNRRKDKNKNVNDEPPPILKHWSRLYSIVMINLLFWLLTFYIIRRMFE